MRTIRAVLVVGFLVIGANVSAVRGQESASCLITPEQLSEDLYLDTTLLPDGFDRDTLTRIFEFLKSHVIPDCRSPYFDDVCQLPVIVRYIPYHETGFFPETTEGHAGWCDAVWLNCLLPSTSPCTVSLSSINGSETSAFLALVAIPDTDDPDYLPQLWGITAHEIAHSLGAIDGPRFPFYEDDKLLAPIDPTSDTYYWFGIAGVFIPGWQGIIWDAWQDTCSDTVCNAFRAEVLLLD